MIGNRVRLRDLVGRAVLCRLLQFACLENLVMALAVIPEIREAGWAAAICRHPQSYFINSPYSRHLVRTMTPPLQRLGLIVALLCPPTISAAGRRQLHARLEEGGQICVAGSAGAAAYAISGKMTTQWQPPGVAYRMLKRQVACAQQRVQVTAMRNTI